MPRRSRSTPRADRTASVSSSCRCSSWRSDRAVSAACRGFGPYRLAGERPDLALGRIASVGGGVERLAELRGVLEALEGILRQCAQDDRIEGAGHLGVDLGRRRSVSLTC